MWQLIIICTISCALLFLIKYTRKTDYAPNGVLYLGNGTLRFLQKSFLGRKRGLDVTEAITREYKLVKARGMTAGVSTQFGRQKLIVCDPELIKSILLTDFDYFTDRRHFISTKHDYMNSKMLFTLRGAGWKQLRRKLSPIFTNWKIKSIFHLFDDSVRKCSKFIESEIGNNGCEVNFTECYSKLAIDVIASTACGIDSEGFKQKESSKFEEMGKALRFHFGRGMLLKFFLLLALPKFISEALRLTFFRKDVRHLN